MISIVPMLLLLVIPITIFIGVLIYLGIQKIKDESTRRIFGIAFIMAFGIALITIGLGMDGFYHNDREVVSQEFLGKYKSIITNSNPDEIELNISESNYSISSNTFTNCEKGTWKTELMDNEYVIQLNCTNGKSLSQFQMKDDILIPVEGNLIFRKVDEN